MESHVDLANDRLHPFGSQFFLEHLLEYPQNNLVLLLFIFRDLHADAVNLPIRGPFDRVDQTFELIIRVTSSLVNIDDFTVDILIAVEVIDLKQIDLVVVRRLKMLQVKCHVSTLMVCCLVLFHPSYRLSRQFLGDLKQFFLNLKYRSFLIEHIFQEIFNEQLRNYMEVLLVVLKNDLHHRVYTIDTLHTEFIFMNETYNLQDLRL